MNRMLATWIEGEYHHAPHRGLGKDTPADRWAQRSEHVRMAGEDIRSHFFFEKKRKVARDRTVTLDGVAFEVDAALVGQTVVLRFDPARPPARRTVEVWSEGKYIELAQRLDALANCYVKRKNDGARTLEIEGAPAKVPEGLSLRDLARETSDIEAPPEGLSLRALTRDADEERS